MSYPRSAGQIPTFYGHKVSGGRSHWKGDYVDESCHPLYPFGFGKSYTSFALATLPVESGTIQLLVGTSALDVDLVGTIDIVTPAGTPVVKVFAGTATVRR